MRLQTIRLPKSLHVVVAELLYSIASLSGRKSPNCVLADFVDKPGQNWSIEGVREEAACVDYMASGRPGATGRGTAGNDACAALAAAIM